MIYSLIKLHRTLRIALAMAAGGTARLWEVSDTIALIEADEATADRTRGPYKKRAT